MRTWVADTTKEEAATTFQRVNGETSNGLSDPHYQVVKSAPLFTLAYPHVQLPNLYRA